MTFITRLKAWFPEAAASGRRPRLMVFGDSHTAALLRAQEFRERGELYQHIRIVRIKKSKANKNIGDMDLDRFCRTIARFDKNDFVFSAIGGNQYAIVSTVRNPVDFDFLETHLDDGIANDGAQLIPMRAIADYIESGVRGNDKPVLSAIRRATKARVFHLLPPPPKEDNAFISSYFDTRFAYEGIERLGPSRPEIRLKCWNIQTACLKRLCEELDIQWVAPPAAALTEKGFLAPRFYAKDVTHANRRYGELVLRQMVDLASTSVSSAGVA